MDRSTRDARNDLLEIERVSVERNDLVALVEAVQPALQRCIESDTFRYSPGPERRCRCVQGTAQSAMDAVDGM